MSLNKVVAQIYFNKIKTPAHLSHLGKKQLFRVPAKKHNIFPINILKTFKTKKEGEGWEELPVKP